MGQHLHKKLLALQHGSKMVFGPWHEQRTNTARFTDHLGATITAGTADKWREAWDFKAPMTALGCHYVATFVGETFGLKVRDSAAHEGGIAFMFHRGSMSYVPPDQLILDRNRRHLVIVLGHKDIIATLNGEAADNLADMAEMLAALHGFPCCRSELGRTTWRRPENEQQPQPEER